MALLNPNKAASTLGGLGGHAGALGAQNPASALFGQRAAAGFGQPGQTPGQALDAARQQLGIGQAAGQALQMQQAAGGLGNASGLGNVSASGGNAGASGGNDGSLGGGGGEASAGGAAFAADEFPALGVGIGRPRAAGGLDNTYANLALRKAAANQQVGLVSRTRYSVSSPLYNLRECCRECL